MKMFFQFSILKNLVKNTYIQIIITVYFIKKNILFNQVRKNIEIILFQDAFEICNPLGSSKKKHKLIGVYMMLGNIPHQYRSCIRNIQLVMLCKESHIKNFSFEVILQPLIRDLN